MDNDISHYEKQSQEKKVPDNRGGRRAGSGRKKGSTNKLTAKSILDKIEHVIGRSFEEQIAHNYLNCITQNDRQMVARYDQFILGKILADRIQAEVSGDITQTIINIVSAETKQYDETEED